MWLCRKAKPRMTGPHNSSTHPQLHPTLEEKRFSWLRLMRSHRVGSATFHRLVADHGSAEAALRALPEIARAAGAENYRICEADRVRDELRRGAAAGARLILHGTPAYPAALAGISNAPPLLWAQGRLDLAHRPVVALVGARNASSLGHRMVRALAHELGEAGFVIVSGLARGIDSSAHQASLPGGAIAVMAGGVDVVYPAENTALAGELARDGLCLSEQPMGTPPQARHFPARNRIISGLARAVIVVEAAARSGSLITARDALDQGRDVLAVPGHPFDARAAGCNMLIRDGAALVRSAADVIEAIGPAQSLAPPPSQPGLMLNDPPASAPAPPPTGPSRPSGPEAAAPQAASPGTSDPQPMHPERRSLRQTAALHMQILDRLGPAPMAEDQLIRDLAANASQVTPALVDLEVAGKIARQAGGLVSRA